jgi:diaminopimelate epimerase
MINNLSNEYHELTIEQIVNLCDRRFGIGADGFIRINSHPTFDFEVDYYNADGSKSFCGNGARCSVHFANSLNSCSNETSFLAIDGVHSAKILKNGTVELEMNDVMSLDKESNDFILNTGSPHYCHFVNDLNLIDITEFGKSIRYSSTYEKHGINVNCIQEMAKNEIAIETYERGVEAETLSCGTGATAAAISYAHKNNLTANCFVSSRTKWLIHKHPTYRSSNTSF